MKRQTCNSRDIFRCLKREVQTEMRLSENVKGRLLRLPPNIRKKLAETIPLFRACYLGKIEIVKFLVEQCGASVKKVGKMRAFNFEQYNLLGWACGSSSVRLVEYVIQQGCDVNARCNDDSTPLHVACAKDKVDIVKCLIAKGADIHIPNENGATCLMLSLKSVDLCRYLIEQGADVNARFSNDERILHRAFEERRLETVKLLLDHGANPFIRRFDKDFLWTACEAVQFDIVNYLIEKFNYTPEYAATSYEFVGSRAIDVHPLEQVKQKMIDSWRKATQIRLHNNIPKRRASCGNVVEFSSLAELERISENTEDLHMQSLIITERVLGFNHLLTFLCYIRRGMFFESIREFQKCINMWLTSVKVRFEGYFVLHSENIYTAYLIVTLMIDLLNRNYVSSNGVRLPQFEDVYSLFKLLTSLMDEAYPILNVVPNHPERGNYDITIQCLLHVIYLLLATAESDKQQVDVKRLVYNTVRKNIRWESGNTLLHMSVMKLEHPEAVDVDGTDVFPNANVTKVLLECGADVNAFNSSRNTPLLVACLTQSPDGELVRLLVSHGAHQDLTNVHGEKATTFLSQDLLEDIRALQCLCAEIIIANGLHNRYTLPKRLDDFVRWHE